MKTPNEIAEEVYKIAEELYHAKQVETRQTYPYHKSKKSCIILTFEQAITTYAEEKVNEQREILAKWMISRSLSTGHGDTIEDLIKELDWQLTELRELKAKQK